MLARLCFVLELEDLLPGSRGCWQNSVPPSCGTKFPIFWQAVSCGPLSASAGPTQSPSHIPVYFFQGQQKIHSSLLRWSLTYYNHCGDYHITFVRSYWLKTSHRYVDSKGMVYTEIFHCESIVYVCTISIMFRSTKGTLNTLF